MRPATMSYRINDEQQELVNGLNRDCGGRLITYAMRISARMVSVLRSGGMSTEDIEQQCWIGIIKAAKKYDATKKAQFRNYAGNWIRRELQHTISEREAQSRRPNAIVTSLDAFDKHNIATKRTCGEQKNTAEEFEDELKRVRLFHSAFRKLNIWEKMILSRRFGLDGLKISTIEEVAKAFDLPSEQVQEITNSAIVKLKKEIAGVIHANGER